MTFIPLFLGFVMIYTLLKTCKGCFLGLKNALALSEL